MIDLEQLANCADSDPDKDGSDMHQLARACRTALEERPERGKMLWNCMAGLKSTERGIFFTWETFKSELDKMLEDEP